MQAAEPEKDEDAEISLVRLYRYQDVRVYTSHSPAEIKALLTARIVRRLLEGYCEHWSVQRDESLGSYQ